jgi:hypothetical protein
MVVYLNTEVRYEVLFEMNRSIHRILVVGLCFPELITVKYMPKPEVIKQKDGEPAVTVKLGWARVRGKGELRYLRCLELLDQYR